MPENPKDQPDAKGLAYERQAEALEIVSDVYAGTLALRKKGEKYLPRFPKETVAGYETRKSMAVLYNALARTVNGLNGMVFRKDVVLGADVPPAIRGDEKGLGGHWENIDLAGRHGAVFGRDIGAAAIRDGHTHVFVDFAPPVEGQPPRTLLEESERGLRPWWIHIAKGALIRFRTESVDGRLVLTQAAWVEQIVVPDGRFGEREALRIRDYQLARSPEDQVFVVWQVHEKRKNEKGEEVWAVVDTGTMTRSSIPLVTIPGNATGFMESSPALLDLALENIGHYQVRSDRRNSLHIAGVPIPVLIGLAEEAELEVASDTGFRLPLGGDAKYLEPTGAALSEMREELRDIEQRMAALGLAMLQRDTRAAETAEARRIEKSETDSQLATVARAIQDGLEEALQIHAEWLDLEDGGSVTVNRDFERQQLDAQAIAQLRAMVLDGQLSIDTLWERLVAGEILPESFDAEEERARIEEGDVERVAELARQNGKRQPAGATP
jgi:hypothetical protein